LDIKKPAISQAGLKFIAWRSDRSREAIKIIESKHADGFPDVGFHDADILY